MLGLGNTEYPFIAIAPRTLVVGGILPLCRGAVGVFYNLICYEEVIKYYGWSKNKSYWHKTIITHVRWQQKYSVFQLVKQSRDLSDLSWPNRLGLQNTLTEYLQWGKTPAQRMSLIWHKKFDSEAPIMLELWKMLSTDLLSPLSGTLWPGGVASWLGPIYKVQ